jgi:hypothetical protein
MMTYCNGLHNGYGTTHMFHWNAGDPMYHQYPGFVYSLAHPSSVSGIGVPTSILFNVFLDRLVEKIIPLL